MSKTNIAIKKRMLFMLAVLLLVLFALICRMFYWQIVKASDLQKLAYSQQTKNRIISPKRGVIYDTNMVTLARSVNVETISVTPKNVKEKEKTAKGLSDILGLEYEAILEKVSKNTSEEVIAKKLDQEVTNKVREWILEEEIKGINIYEDTKRAYPKGSFLAQVLGFCGTDNQGLDGIEAKYESVLKGVPGQWILSTDATGKEIPITDDSYIPPEDGLNLVLTIDERVQHVVEKHLEQAMIDNAPVEYGVCVVMNPKNGDILAMATAPDYDPNDPFTVTDPKIAEKWDTLTTSEKTKARQEMWRNRAVTDTYEPGSVFKVVTSAIALEEKIVSNVDAVNFSCTGKLKVEGWDIKCWRSYNPHGTQSLRMGLMNSCNPVFMNVAMKVGPENFYKYLEAFGVSKNTGSDLIGETSGIIHDVKDVTGSTIATAAFGQGFTLTPLNMLNVMCAIANDGKLMQPRIVKKIIDNEGNTVKDIEKKVIKQVISEETSDKVLDMMESVVSDGTGRYAQVKGYYIAGKTSTAEQGRGANKKFVASFVGMAPADDPEVAVIFNLYNPQSERGHQGGGICAPVVGNILSEILENLEVPKDYEYQEDTKNTVVVPDVTNRTLAEAKKTLTNIGLKYSVDEADDNVRVVSQMPVAGETLTKKSLVKIFTEGNDTRFGTTVPDLRGMDITTASKKLAESNLNIKVSGTGVAILQSPPAKTTVEQGTIVKVEFRPAGIDVE
ncbi:MAG: PASTA domain-containing protein [Clostridia bacterium]|nr:PASTA domain-containing protein [Clostridia bacterium]